MSHKKDIDKIINPFGMPENPMELIGHYYLLRNRKQPLPTVAFVVAVELKSDIIYYQANNDGWKSSNLKLSKSLTLFMEEAIPVAEAAEVLYF